MGLTRVGCESTETEWFMVIYYISTTSFCKTASFEGEVMDVGSGEFKWRSRVF
jgi:hypothetical protein